MIRHELYAKYLRKISNLVENHDKALNKLTCSYREIKQKNTVKHSIYMLE